MDKEQRMADDYIRSLLNEKTSHKRSLHDTLFTGASAHYWDKKTFSDVFDKMGEPAAITLARQVARSKGKQYSWNRRVYSNSYCTRSENGQEAYMHDNAFGGRMEPEVVGTWNVGDDWNEQVNAVIFRLPCRPHGKAEYGGEGEFGSWLAGYMVRDCDGITVDVSSIYSDVNAANCAANSMASHAAENIEIDNEKHQQEIRTDEISEELTDIRRDVLNLIRHLKPIRCDIPAAIVTCVMRKISDMLHQRQELFKERNEMPG